MNTPYNRFSAHLPQNNPASGITTTGAVSGETTTAPGTTSDLALSLNFVLGNPGTFGSDTAVPVITINNAGQIVSATQVDIASSGGTVTSVGVASTDLTVSGSPITNAGNITLNLGTTAVTPGTYGDATHVAQVTIDSKGRVTAAANVSISGGGSGTVTNVSSANGDLTVANPTTTPVLTINSAPKWDTARTLSFTGNVTGSGSVDGSANVATALTIANSGVTAATYGDSTHVGQFTVNAEGRITSASNVAISAGGSGTVTSVGLASPNSSIALSGTNPVTTSGTINVDIASSANLPGSPTTTTQSAGDNSTKVATTAFTTTAIANAIAAVNPAVAVQAASNAILPNSPTYSNGVSGIGATITAGVTNTALVVDGYTPVLNDRILVKNEGSGGGLGASRNGVYFVSQVAAVGLAWILTRALDYDQPSDINNTGAIPVVNGTANIDTSWLLTSSVTTVGTDPLTYVLFTVAPANVVQTGGVNPTNHGVVVGQGTNVVGSTSAGTSGQVLTSNGASADPTFQASTGRLLAIQRFSTAGTSTPTYNAATTAIFIRLLGAGGGGRSVAAPPAANVAIGVAGGGGAYLEKYISGRANFVGKQLVVGAKGTGGAAAGAPNNGTAGTATTFDAAGANYSAGGGVGGSGTNVAPYGWIVNNTNIGGTASNGDLNVTAPSQLNFSVNATTPSASSQGGAPANPMYGAGGISQAIVSTAAQAGGNGSGNGSGGSGGITFNGTTPLKGGDGTDGYAEIWEYS